MKPNENNQTTTALQQLVFGDRNTFVFLQETTDATELKPSKVAKFLVKLSKNGYAISNADVLMNYSKEDFKRFKSEFFDLVEANSKEGFILRKSFAQGEDLEEYETEDWKAIFAQYAITYGLMGSFKCYFGNENPETVFADYLADVDGTVSELKTTGTKVFSIAGETKFKDIIKDILESKVVLRAQQLKTLENTPKYILAEVAGNSNISIKETLVKVMDLLKGVSLDFPLLKTSTDVLRFVVQAYAHEPVEGQINKTILKDVKLRIPTSVRKALLNNLELLGSKKGSKFLTEDMLGYENFWKRLDKYLRYTTSSKTRTKYPNYTYAIDLVYANDRSWTFNSRYSVAKSERDYDKAIRVAAERRGFLLRNIVEFLRMEKGSKMPVKNGEASKEVHNPLHDVLSRKFSPTLTEKFDTKIVQTDATEFFKHDFKNAIQGANSKLLWQLLANISREEILEPIYDRTVQGISIVYTTPIPGASKKMVQLVKNVITEVLKDNLRPKNTENIFIDDSTFDYNMEFSGRSNTGISFAGEFLSRGSSLDLDEIVKSKGLNDPILRLGIMWRGKEGSNNYSVDIDHSLNVDDKNKVYYGNPTLSNNKQVLITSSGDITSSGTSDDLFSTEIVDIDVEACRTAGISKMVNSANVYSGYSKMGDYETYYFMQVIERKDRVQNARQVKVDLAKCDYAIQIDPDNTEKSGAYVGFVIDIKNNKLTTMNLPVQQVGSLNNIFSNTGDINKAIGGLAPTFSLGKALKFAFNKSQRTDIEDANIVVSRKSREQLKLDDSVTLLHPGRDGEKLQELYF